ncbi:MAG: hypothetical protein QW785_01205 [Candidatus Anstonellales archaeon]
MNSQSLNTREKSMEFRPYEPGYSVNEHNEIIVKLMPGEFAINAAIYGLLYNYHRFNDINNYQKVYLSKLVEDEDNYLKEQLQKVINEDVKFLIDKSNIEFVEDGGVIINLTRYIKLLWINYWINFLILSDRNKQKIDEIISILKLYKNEDYDNIIKRSSIILDHESVDIYSKKVAKLFKIMFRASFVSNSADFPNYLSSEKNKSYNNSYNYFTKLLALANPKYLDRKNTTKCVLTHIPFYNTYKQEEWGGNRYLTYMMFKFIDPKIKGEGSKPYVNWDRSPQDKRFPISDLTYLIIIPHFYLAFRIDDEENKYKYRYFINTTYSLKLLYHLNEKFERLSKLSNNTILTLPKTIHIALRLSNLMSLGFEVYKIENDSIQRFYISPLVINLLSNSRLITALKSVKEESLIATVMNYILNENFSKIKYLIYEKLKDYLKNPSQTNNSFSLIKNLIKIYEEIILQLFEYRDLDTGGGKNMKETRPISQGRFYNSLKNQELLKEVLKNSSYQLLEATRTENWERVGYLISRAMIITGEKTYELINLLNMLPPENELQAEVLKISIYNLLVALNSELVDTSTQGEGQ